MRRRWVVLGLVVLFGAMLVGMPSPAAADLKVGVSGYVKLDIQFSDKILGTQPSPGVASTPLDSDKERDNSQTVLDVRESRLRVTFADEVSGVKLSGLIETDFFTFDGNAKVSNSRHLRLRHAFARADHPSGFFLLAGQWWSLFVNIVTVPPPAQVDFASQSAKLFARQPQLKVGYKTPLGNGMGELVFEADVEKSSLENLGSPAVDESQGAGQDLPRFVGKVSWFHPIFQVEAAGAAGSNRVILAGGDDDRETSWGAQVSVGVNIGPVRLAGHYDHLDGVQGFANDRFPTAFLVGSKVENVESDAWYAGFTYNFTKATSFNFLYGWEEADEIKAAGFTGKKLETLQSIHVNVFHKFWKRWMVGLEYRRFDVDAFNDEEGDANLVHGALWFFF